MALDVTFTNGVIAAREKYLLKEKILRFCEMTAEEAFRALLESGFGGGSETAASVYEYEKLVAAEENALDQFILEYAPSEAERAYLLSPRDFHNAKAFLKAAYLKTDAEKMLAPEGEIPLKTLETAVASGDFSEIGAVNAELKTACEEAAALLNEETVSGAEIGGIFEKASFVHLKKVCRKNAVLKKLLPRKADMLNILTALRAGEKEIAIDKYLPTGKLKTEQLDLLFEADFDKAEEAFKNTPYAAFLKKCLDAKKRGAPMTEAERDLASLEFDFLDERRYELKNTQPFLYYVFRRRGENANVRIVFVCKLAGLNEQEIKRRLRAAR
ncbi:MAG: V-type ATPase subunit [Clostridia bacterium]|nr:V-type ATPase subunit [Clostridia bacterium]